MWVHRTAVTPRPRIALRPCVRPAIFIGTSASFNRPAGAKDRVRVGKEDLVGWVFALDNHPTQEVLFLRQFNPRVINLL